MDRLGLFRVDRGRWVFRQRRWWAVPALGIVGFLIWHVVEVKHAALAPLLGLAGLAVAMLAALLRVDEVTIDPQSRTVTRRSGWVGAHPVTLASDELEHVEYKQLHTKMPNGPLTIVRHQVTLACGGQRLLITELGDETLARADAQRLAHALALEVHDASG